MSYDPSRFEQEQPFGQPEPKKSRTPLILAIVAGVGLLGIAICCGFGVWMANFGMSLVGAEIENELRDHPQVREHVGEIKSLDIDWPKSLAEEGDDVLVFDVEGTTGTGELIVNTVTNDDGDEEILDAKLRLESGEIVELNIEP